MILGYLITILSLLIRKWSPRNRDYKFTRPSPLGWGLGTGLLSKRLADCMFSKNCHYISSTSRLMHGALKCIVRQQTLHSRVKSILWQGRLCIHIGYSIVDHGMAWYTAIHTINGSWSDDTGPANEPGLRSSRKSLVRVPGKDVHSLRRLAIVFT